MLICQLLWLLEAHGLRHLAVAKQEDKKEANLFVSIGPSEVHVNSLTDQAQNLGRGHATHHPCRCTQEQIARLQVGWVRVNVSTGHPDQETVHQGHGDGQCKLPAWHDQMGGQEHYHIDDGRQEDEVIGEDEMSMQVTRFDFTRPRRRVICWGASRRACWRNSRGLHGLGNNRKERFSSSKNPNLLHFCMVNSIMVEVNLIYVPCVVVNQSQKAPKTYRNVFQ